MQKDRELKSRKNELTGTLRKGQERTCPLSSSLEMRRESRVGATPWLMVSATVTPSPRPPRRHSKSRANIGQYTTHKSRALQESTSARNSYSSLVVGLQSLTPNPSDAPPTRSNLEIELPASRSITHPAIRPDIDPRAPSAVCKPVQRRGLTLMDRASQKLRLARDGS